MAILALLRDLWQPLSLRSRQSILLVTSVVTVVAITSTYFVLYQRQAMLEQMELRSRIMREEVGRKGLAIASTVGLSCERAIAFKDFLFLAQVIKNIPASDKQFVYGALVNDEGRAMVHTDAALAWQVLAGESDQEAARAEQPLVRELDYKGQRIVEVVQPLRVANRRWGVVRFGLSLDALNAAIQAQRAELDALIGRGILTSILVAAVLVVLSGVFGTLAAQALTRPLGKLMEGVRKLQGGTTTATVVVKGSPEFVDLARAFNDMNLAVRGRESALESALAQADEANRLKSEFLANISHELRTPLNSIINVPAALIEDFPFFRVWRCPLCVQDYEPEKGTSPAETDSEACPECGSAMELAQRCVFTGEASEHRRLNERASSSARHLLHVVNDLLDFSRLQAGKMKLHLEDYDIAAVVEETLGLMQGLAEPKGQILTSRLPSTAVVMHGDRVKMGQVLVNLVGNAIKFTPEKGRIAVTVERGFQGDEACVHFLVADTGIGIPEDKLEAIFEPFRQVDGSHTRAYGGTGLGLAITAQIARLHGGRVWAESSRGNGSKLHVVVPVTAKLAVNEEAAPPPQVTVKGLGAARRVVIVDDDPTYLEVCQHMLTDVGMHVDVVSRPEEAYDHILSSLPNFVIIDVMMPNVSGLDVLRRLKTTPTTQAIPVIVSTAHHGNEAAVARLGGIWLPKPWRPDDLLQCLLAHKVFLLADHDEGGVHAAQEV